MPTTDDVLHSALQAEAAGVPVDWKRLAFLVNEAAKSGAQKTSQITDPQTIREIMEKDDAV